MESDIQTTVENQNQFQYQNQFQNSEENNKSQISFLPKEILSKIFSFVSTKDLLSNVAQVSKDFNELTKNSASHVAVHLDYKNEITSVNSFLNGKKNIREISFEERADSCCIGVLSVLDLGILQQTETASVELAGKWIGPLIFYLLSENRWKARQIRKFKIRTKQTHFAALLNRSIDFENLTHLQLTSDALGIDRLLEIATISRKLQSLKSDSRFNSVNSKEFESFVQSCKDKFETLHLPHYLCTNGDFKRLTNLCQRSNLSN